MPTKRRKSKVKGRRSAAGPKGGRKPAPRTGAKGSAARAPRRVKPKAAPPVPRRRPGTVVSFGKKPPPGPRFRSEVAEMVARILGDVRGATPRTMFGLPAWYVGEKLFACVYGEGVGLRFHERRARQLRTVTGFFPFRPYGRAETKGWVCLVRDIPAQYLAYRTLFHESAAFAQSLAERKKTPGKPAGSEVRRRAAR